MKRLLFMLCLLVNLCNNTYADTSYINESLNAIKNHSLVSESATVIKNAALKESNTAITPHLIADKTNSNIRIIQESSNINITSAQESNVIPMKENESSIQESNAIFNKSLTTSGNNEISLEDLEVGSSTKLESSTTNGIDPHENFNRNAYRMNDTLDKNFLRPVTVWYVDYVPGFMRAGAQNFFNNLRDFVTLGNDILQLNTYRSIKDTGRVCVNSTIGLLGLFDVAKYWGMPDHINTFGHTMRFYGWENSSYVVLPFLGPSTIRDALGMIPDTFFNPTWWINYPYSNYVSVGLFTVSELDTRAKLLPFDQSLNTAIDPYTSVRDFYLQSTGNMPQAANTAKSNESSAAINTASNSGANDSQLESLIDEK